MKKLNFIIPLVIYPFDVMVNIGESNEELIKRLDRYVLSDEDIELAKFDRDTEQGRCVLFSTNQTLIRLKNIPTTPYQQGLLQHEIFHCVMYIMKNIGMELEIGKSDEAYAYLVGYLTTEIHKKLNNTKDKII